MKSRFSSYSIPLHSIIVILTLTSLTCKKEETTQPVVQPVTQPDIRITISKTNLTYGTVTVGQTSDQSLSISNSSSSTSALTGSVSSSGTGFSIVSGSGSFNLSPGQSKTVTIRFSPSSATSYSGSVSITHNATNQTSPTTVSLSGTGQVVTSILISINRSSIDFDTVTVGQSSDQSFIINNSSNSTGTLSGSVSSTGSAFSISSGSGSYNLSPGQSKTVTVRYSPASPTNHSGSVTITHNATNQSSPTIVSLSGIGTQHGTSIITVNPTSFDNGSEPVGNGVAFYINISNASNATTNLIGSVSITGSAFSILLHEGSFSISPGNSIDVLIQFAPTEPVAYSGSLIITHYATNQSSPITVPLSGIGVQPGIIISISPSSINFGTVTVGQTSDQSLSISNSSSSTSALTGSVSNSGTGFSIVSGSGSFNLSPGQSKTVTVRFSPSSATSYSGSVSITHNATNQTSPTTVSLSGLGQTATSIVMSVSPTSINFGTVTVGQTSDQSLSISNSSSSTSTLTGSVSKSGTGFSIVSGSGSFNLSPGQSKTVTVRFSPSSVTSYSGSISITHNATNQTSPTTVSLSGSGQVATSIVMSVSPTSINFGTVTVGQTSDQSLSIGNSSSSTSALTGSVSISGTEFSIVSGSGSFNLSPGQSKTVTVRFSPSSATSYSGSVSITHNATNQTSPTLISLSGIGEELIGLIVAHRGYSTSTHWTYESADIYVGYKDNPIVNNVQNRGFGWFTIPSYIRTATVVEAYLIVDVQDISQWNSLLNWVLLEHLGTLTWSSFSALPSTSRYDALIGESVGYKSKAATLNFTISSNLFYLLQQNEVGFSFRSQPEIPSGSIGDQTNQIILNDPILYVRYH